MNETVDETRTVKRVGEGERERDGMAGILCSCSTVKLTKHFYEIRESNVRYTCFLNYRLWIVKN